MYHFIKGKVFNKKPPIVILDNNGIGYEISVSMNTYDKVPNLNEEVMLFIHFVPREDAHNLFGFYSLEEKEVFLKLINVNGIGPKSAIAILSSVNPTELAKFIVEEKTSFLQTIPGIGKKTAERIIVELKDKFKDMDFDANVTKTNISSIGEEAINALITLGYNKNIAEKTISNIIKSNANIDNVETLIKLSLKNIN